MLEPRVEVARILDHIMNVGGGHIPKCIFVVNSTFNRKDVPIFANISGAYVASSFKLSEVFSGQSIGTYIKWLLKTRFARVK